MTCTDGTAIEIESRDIKKKVRFAGDLGVIHVVETTALSLHGVLELIYEKVVIQKISQNIWENRCK